MRGTADAPGIAWESDPNCGLYLISSDNMGFSTNGSLRMRITNTGLVMNSAVSLVGGSAAAPSLTFIDGSDSDTGIYRAGANQLSISTNGVERMRISTTQVHNYIPVELSLGTTASPSIFFAGDSNTGMFSPAADQLALVTNGTNRLQISSSISMNAVTNFQAGSLTFPSWSFQGDTDTGVYRPGVNTLGVVAGGIDRLRVSDTFIEANVVVDMQAAQPCLIYTYALQSINDSTLSTLATASGAMNRNIGSFGTSPNWFTVPSTGTYLVCGYTTCAFNATGERFISLNINGTQQARQMAFASVSNAHEMTTSGIFQMTSGEYIGLTFLHTSGVSLNTAGRLQIFRLA
jgi:hypothetical protein